VTQMDPRDLQSLEELCIEDEAPWCQAACPLHVDVRSMLAAVARGDFRAAADIYGKKVLFPGIISRICDQPCRAVCKRREAGEALQIGLLERSCAEYAGFASDPVAMRAHRSHRVAVVGGGLSGMSAALELVGRHHEVTILEASDRLGRRLWDFPAAVLPLEVVDEEIGRVVDGNVRVLTGIHLGRDATLDELLSEFDAVYVAFGGLEPVVGGGGLDPAAHHAVAGGIDPVTLATNVEGVFAGGSLRHVRESYSPVSSMADGRRAAITIDRFFKRESLTLYREREGPYATVLHTSLAGVEPRDSIAPTGAAMSYSAEEATAEAGRCLQCRCLECVKACTYLDHFREYPGKCIRKVTKNITSLPGKSHRTHTPFLNACSLCGLCGAVCPTDLNMAVVNGVARQIMWDRGYMPPAIHDSAMRDMESSNAGFNALTRNQPGCTSSAYLFFPGCQLAASSPTNVERTYLYLTSRLRGGVGLMLGCCGAPAAWAGRRDLFDEVLGAFIQHWEQMGRPLVILACPTCSLMFKEHLAYVSATSLWEVLDHEGLPEGAARGRGEVLALHDSCTARSAPAIQDSVRNIVGRLGYEIEELPYSRELTKCCGYGGLMYRVDQDLTEKVIASRVQESPSDYLTYCSNCRDFFAGKAKPAYHVLDLIFDGYTAGLVARSGPTFSERRDNRRRLAEKLLTELWGEPMPESPEHTRVKLRISPRVSAKMEENFILADDVQQVIHQAEKTGIKLELPTTGRFIAHLRLSMVTYWVEYGMNGDEYEVFNAYCHRMQIVTDVKS
jgi:glutamate synthase (NADPH/NADH) small chain